jgi:hypothetical protein
MKERPILFSGPMVRAILEGRKTQTRRIIKSKGTWSVEDADDFSNRKWPGYEDEYGTWTDMPCSYGNPGDRLWVRETFSSWHHGCQWHDCTREGRSKVSCSNLFYRSTHHFPDDDQRWVPSIFMPRWASRITLEITRVWVERLQDISNADCTAEGITASGKAVKLSNGSYAQAGRYENKASTVRQLFSELWTSINGPGSWNANPWVWAIEFARVA